MEKLRTGAPDLRDYSADKEEFAPPQYGLHEIHGEGDNAAVAMAELYATGTIRVDGDGAVPNVVLMVPSIDPEADEPEIETERLDESLERTGERFTIRVTPFYFEEQRSTFQVLDEVLAGTERPAVIVIDSFNTFVTGDGPSTPVKVAEWAESRAVLVCAITPTPTVLLTKN